MNGLKAQKPLAQGKGSGTLGDAFVSVAYALKGQKHKDTAPFPVDAFVSMLLPFQGAIAREVVTQGVALGYVQAGLSARSSPMGTLGLGCHNVYGGCMHKYPRAERQSPFLTSQCKVWECPYPIARRGRKPASRIPGLLPCCVLCVPGGSGGVTRLRCPRCRCRRSRSLWRGRRPRSR